MITLKELSFSYSRKKEVLDRINLEVGSGHICGLLGKNGEGKTTLLNLLSGQIFPDIIRKTKCFDFWERNVLFPKTKRSFFRTPTLPFSA